MATNLAISDELIQEAQNLGHFQTKKETVTVALNEYVQRIKQQEILELFGTIDYDNDYDYKKLRNR